MENIFDIKVVYKSEVLIYIRNLYYKKCIECKSARDAAENGHLDCLDIFHNKESSLASNDKWICSFAASKGNLKCLEYLHSRNYQWNSWTCEYAAANGHLDCLQYLHENDCPWNLWSCIKAAENGHLDCLQYLHENNCQWNEVVCSWAAKNGHLDCLQYAREHGCPWNEYTCIFAERYGNLDCLEYAHNNNCPCAHNSRKIYTNVTDSTTENKDIECAICITNSHKVEFIPCGHRTCASCVNKLIRINPNFTCHLCRGIVTDTFLIDIREIDYLLAIEPDIFY